MITVTKEEYDNMVASAEAILIVKCLNALDLMKKGKDINDINIPISVAYCNLLSLENYDTEQFNPEGYFNIMDPTHVSKSFSNINTINTNNDGKKTL